MKIGVKLLKKVHKFVNNKGIVYIRSGKGYKGTGASSLEEESDK